MIPGKTLSIGAVTPIRNKHFFSWQAFFREGLPVFIIEINIFIYRKRKGQLWAVLFWSSLLSVGGLLLRRNSSGRGHQIRLCRDPRGSECEARLRQPVPG